MPLADAQQRMAEFFEGHPILSPFHRSGDLRMDLGAGPSGSVKLDVLLVGDELRALGLTPSAGALAMERLCAVCDELGHELRLLAKPLPKMPAPDGSFDIIALPKLVAFYERFGFTADFDQHSTLATRMRRPARPFAPPGPSLGASRPFS